MNTLGNPLESLEKSVKRESAGDDLLCPSGVASETRTNCSAADSAQAPLALSSANMNTVRIGNLRQFLLQSYVPTLLLQELPKKYRKGCQQRLHHPVSTSTGCRDTEDAYWLLPILGVVDQPSYGIDQA